jgi:hypothetical protein
MAFATVAEMKRHPHDSTAADNPIAAEQKERSVFGPSYCDRPPATNQDLMKIRR